MNTEEFNFESFNMWGIKEIKLNFEEGEGFKVCIKESEKRKVKYCKGFRTATRFLHKQDIPANKIREIENEIQEYMYKINCINYK